MMSNPGNKVKDRDDTNGVGHFSMNATYNS